ncbi:hypothetical protein KSW81_000089 [Nannochloris sp. 'desiccata']|nr:hypothetical protein KSW81_000089 [Chlorella desiccata (nom. nud.)]
MSWARLREAIALRVKQIQTVSDKQLTSLPASSRLILAPILSSLAALSSAREPTLQFLYRSGIFSTFTLPAPVISIGNLTSASGKTPYVEYLARHYWDHHGVASLIIQLGSGTVDETHMLRESFTDTPVKVIDTDSANEAREILQENPAVKLVLLDNGLQHLPLQRDFDILTINSIAPFGNGHLIPRGTLREPYRLALKRTDSVIVHHVDIAGQEGVTRTLGKLGPLLPRHALQTLTQMVPVSLKSLVSTQRSLDMSEFQGLGEDLGLSRLSGAAVVCLTGVGSPAIVEEHLRRLGALHVEGCGVHEDHHMFSIEEVEEAVSRVRELAADEKYSHACILLTEKDYARQSDLWSSVFATYANEVYSNSTNLEAKQQGDDNLVKEDKEKSNTSGEGPGQMKKWGAYVLHSQLEIVEHDRRFSSQKAVLGAMLRRAISTFAQATSPTADVIVVGAGVAGLNCAAKLHKKGIPVLVLEASDGPGGRVRTDKHEGFLLDRGFQIFLTSYPEAQEALDYEKLDLRPFYAGALVHWAGGFHRVADPLRHFVDGLASIPNPIGSPVDKINVGLFRLKSLLGSVDDIFKAPETTILKRLQTEGFSDAMIDRFFRPFLGGIFFDRELGTSSRMFSFVMRMLATGQNCLPAAGIGAVADQLVSQIPADSLRLNCTVSSVSPGTNANENTALLPSVTMADGSVLNAKAIVVATEGPVSKQLLGSFLASAPSKDAAPVGTCCLYFAAPKPPLPGNILYLDGDGGQGIVNNCCFPSEVSPTYAPAGQTLVSVSTLGTLPNMSDEELQKTVLNELSEWFKNVPAKEGSTAKVSSWRHLKTYRIPYAQPNQAPPTDSFRKESLGNGLWVAGDHRTSATLDGALRSGRVVAEQIIAELS